MTTTWTDIPGARAGIAAAGLRRSGKPDVVVLQASGVAAAVTTTSSAAAACCRWTRALTPGLIEAVVINAGNANAATGAQGEAANRAMAETTAEALGCRADQVLVCSTGVIGQQLPLDALLPAITRAAKDLTASSAEVARAILTTDLAPKEASAIGPGFSVAGIAKGSGMIHPNMATMLGFIVTDASLSGEDLSAALLEVNARTFNAISVDGDTSTNDTVILQSTGLGATVRAGEPGWRAFIDALEQVAKQLALAIVADGEGATRTFEVGVSGTPSDVAARAAAKAVVRSPLVKTAVHGSDANWGRIVGALGAEGVGALDEVSITIGGHPVVTFGAPVDFDEATLHDVMSRDHVVIDIALPGDGVGRAWGCDLGPNYISINADYRS